MKIELHETWEHVRELSEEWNRLLAVSSSNTIFLTWEWLDAWWKNYGLNRPLFVLAAWDGNSLEGLAPFFVDRSARLGTEWVCLRLIGDGSRDSDYLDCIARRGRERDVIGAFTRFLASHAKRWNYIELHGTPEESPCLTELLASARQQSWNLSLERIPCATLALPRDWDCYLRSLKPRFRTKLRSTIGYFERQLGATPYACSEQQVEQWLPILFDLHTRRWQLKHKPGVFGNMAKQNFYRDISRAASQKGWLAFHRLDWGERALALQYGFSFANRFFLLQEGYDPDFAMLRPGMALRGSLMRHFMDAGLTEYDFLAGAAPYKLEWGAAVKWSVRLTLAPTRSAAWVSFGAARMREAAKDAVRNLIPQRILDARRARAARKVKRPSTPALPMQTNGHRQSLGRRIAAALYGSTPLGTLGRAVASHYVLIPQRYRLRPRTVPIYQIFIYHRVNDDFDPFLPSVPVAAFRKQMEFLKKHFSVLSLNELATSSFPENGQKFHVAITFDDGYRDNFLCAFPVLRDLGLPATIFLTTGCLESRELPWYDQISWAFKLTAQPRFSVAHIRGPEASLQGFRERLQSRDKTLVWLRTIEQNDRLRCIGDVLRSLRVPKQISLPNPMLSWEEVRQMTKWNISFGAHTVSHPVLATLTDDQLNLEITGSKRAIEDRLQIPVRHFAYPFGQPSDVGANAKQAVRRAGFSAAVTTVWGFNNPGSDVFELKRFSPRFNPWDFHPGRFAMMLDWYRLTGVGDRKDTGQLGKVEERK